MCLIGFIFNPNSNMPLILAANRDEWRARPTQAAHWWPDHHGVFAGRDLQAGGTWLGAHRRGRVAALTNVREPQRVPSDSPSRGFLVSHFLHHDGKLSTYGQALRDDAQRYAGFNLLMFERTEGEWLASWLSNRAEHARGGQPLNPGCHVLSNHLLNTPWPKALRLRSRLQAVAQSSSDPGHELLEALTDDEIPPDEQLPDTGIGVERERALAAALIRGEAYGTRSSTVLQIAADGQVSVIERTWAWSDGRLLVSAEHSTRFRLDDE
jgi:uncharacterized protein with NRDE domain